MRSKLLMTLIAILAFLGFLDTTYLTILHYQNIIPPCSITQGCEIVLRSKFAALFGLPISLFGSIHYFLVLGVSVALLTTNKKTLRPWLLALIVAGFFISLIFFFIQTFILRAFCQYCLFLDIISFLLLIFVLPLLRGYISSSARL